MSVQTEEVLRNDRELVRLYAAQRGSISRPIAHRKAAISRGIAAVTTVWRLPAAISRQYRAHSRTGVWNGQIAGIVEQAYLGLTID